MFRMSPAPLLMKAVVGPEVGVGVRTPWETALQALLIKDTLIRLLLGAGLCYHVGVHMTEKDKIPVVQSSHSREDTNQNGIN